MSSSFASNKHDSGTVESPDATEEVPNIVNEGSAISVVFPATDAAMATESLFLAPWLWHSDPTYIHPSSGQRLRRLSQYPGWKIAKAEIIIYSKAAAASQENQSSSGATVPSPAPPPACLHSIGTVYSTLDHDKNHCLAADTGSPGGSSSSAKLLKITWDKQSSNETNNEPNVSFYDLNWLQRCRNDDVARRSRVQRTQISPTNALGRHASCPTILEVNYSDLFPSNDDDFQTANKNTLLELLHGISEHGAVLIRQAPLGNFVSYNDQEPTTNDEDDRSAAVSKVGRALGGGALSHGALYGDLFHVRSMSKANNIAYTSVALGPHQDLAYYESKPGLQLLHCIRNDQQRISGGESVLIDAIAAAEYLKVVAPQHFRTLCRCHATFLKQREGADMQYSRPHIVMGDMEQVVAVHWSPPFEGPHITISQDDMEDYIMAYAAFERLLDDQLFDSSSSSSSAILPPDLDDALQAYSRHYTWERSLEPGDMLVFNNQRMLHGRRGFELLETSRSSADDEHQVHRHLAGCYTNIDDTINTYRMLLRSRPDREDWVIRCFGNGTGGSL